MKRIAVIGGGIYGCVVALKLAQQYKVELFEKASDILQETSSINQYRIHRGYHYPRSRETIRSCAQSYSRFNEEFRGATIADTEHYYCIAKEGSRTRAAEYLRICQSMGLDYQVETTDIVAQDRIDLCIKVPELAFDPCMLKILCKRKLEAAGVVCHLNTSAGIEISAEFDFVVACTYSQNNRFVPSEMQRDYQFELYEKPVVKLPNCFNGKSVVVMDGPYMSLDPFGKTGHFVMGHVVHAIHQTIVDKLPAFDSQLAQFINRGVIQKPAITKFDALKAHAIEYFPAFRHAEHVGSMFTIRAVLPNVNKTDTRMSLVEHVGGNLITVFGGKIACSLAAADKVEQLVTALGRKKSAVIYLPHQSAHAKRDRSVQSESDNMPGRPSMKKTCVKIAVVGAGYVGLVAAACFASAGYEVTCIDHDPKKIQVLKKSGMPIFEPGLERLVAEGISKQALHFTTSMAKAVKSVDAVFMAVGTPSLPNGNPDLTYLKMAAEEVARHISEYCIVVNKSTVPIGTHKLVKEWMSQYAVVPFDVVSNPEFMREGSAITDFLEPERIIVGTDNETVFQKMRKLYLPMVAQGTTILKMDPISAETTKYACNAFLAVRISFMNEIARLCEKAGGDVEQVRQGMATDERIGKHLLQPGIGYGGSCFPKDVKALVSVAQQYDVPMQIAAVAESTNERQKRHLVVKVKEVFGNDLKGRTFALWGLAFKPKTDDIREAPSIAIVEDLLAAGARVRAYDPVANGNMEKRFGDKITFCSSPYLVLEGADALLIVTDWNEFKRPDFDLMKEYLMYPILFDGRNMYDPMLMKELEIAYFSIGRPSVALPHLLQNKRAFENRSATLSQDARTLACSIS